jgi:hypothetical protein
MERDGDTARRTDERRRDRELALRRIRTFQKTLPADWKFDRHEANTRRYELQRSPG